MRATLPGLLVVVALAGAAALLSPYAGGLGVVVVALGLGAVVGNVVRVGEGPLAPGVTLVEKRGLAVAIALLGFGVDGAAVVGLGARGGPALVVALIGTLVGAVWLGRLLGVPPALALLVGAGQGICGTAAVAAVSPVVGARDEETGVAVGVVNALGTVGLVALPALGVAAGLSGDGMALVLGGALQSVGHAVAAGFGVSDEVGRATAVVKLARVATLPIVILALSWRRGGARTAVGLPWEVAGFLVAAAAANLGLVPAAWRAALGDAAEVGLVLAMAAIGTRIRLAALRADGPRALALGAVLFAAQLGWLFVIAA